MCHAISFSCAGCNARIKAPLQLQGHVRACPGCGRRCVVQRTPPRDEGPVLVPGDQFPIRPAGRGRL